MVKVNFDDVKIGDLVEVPRTQFAPMRQGWNGWLFSEAVVIQKGYGSKNHHKVIKVEMRTPGKRGSEYNTMVKVFNADCVFKTKSLERAINMMKRDGINSKEEFYAYVKKEEVVGCDWIYFLIDKGFLF
jgi:choline kinase